MQSFVSVVIVGYLHGLNMRDLRWMPESGFWRKRKWHARKAFMRNYGIKKPRSFTLKQRRRNHIVTLYMKAIGTERLSQKAWERIARVNQLVLEKY